MQDSGELTGMASGTNILRSHTQCWRSQHKIQHYPCLPFPDHRSMAPGSPRPPTIPGTGISIVSGTGRGGPQQGRAVSNDDTYLLDALPGCGLRRLVAQATATRQPLRHSPAPAERAHTRARRVRALTRARTHTQTHRQTHRRSGSINFLPEVESKLVKRFYPASTGPNGNHLGSRLEFMRT